MIKLTLAMAGLAAVIGCNDGRDRGIPANGAPGRPVDLSLEEETLPTADSPALEREIRPASQKRMPAPVPDPEPSPAPEAADPPDSPAPAPESAPGSQPATAPEPPSAPEPAPASAPEPGSEPRVEPDTEAYAPYPAGEPAVDPAGSAPADTTVPPVDTINLPAAEPDSAPAPSTEVAATPSTSAAGILAAGTVIHAILDDSIHSRHDVSGKLVTGRVMENVIGRDGLTIIPAGAPVQFTVTQVKPGTGSRPGVLEIRVDAVTIDGQPRKLEARIEPISRELRGRGVTGDEAAKVAVGAAGGAVVGRVVGGNTKGAVIGGVVGAAGGAVVASKTASKDVVVKARTPVVFVLTAPYATSDSSRNK